MSETLHEQVSLVTAFTHDQEALDDIKEGYKGSPSEVTLAQRYNDNVDKALIEKESIRWPNKNAPLVDSMSEGVQALNNIGQGRVLDGDQPN